MRIGVVGLVASRVLLRTVVLDVDGEPCRTEGGGADALAAHWGLTLESACGVDSVAMHQLRNGIVGTSGATEGSLHDLRRVLARCPRSAPGPDGTAYAHWAGAVDVGLHALYDAYVSVLDGGTVPQGFNDGILVFIPKTSILPGQYSHRAKPRDLRPLTLGNTSHKLLMLLMKQMLEAVAAEVVHPCQSGVIRGSDILVNMVELEAAVAGFLHDEGSEPEAVLLYIAVACPSAEWEYIVWALGAQGVVPSLISALFALCGPTECHPRDPPRAPCDRHCLGFAIRSQCTDDVGRTSAGGPVDHSIR